MGSEPDDKGDDGRSTVSDTARRLMPTSALGLAAVLCCMGIAAAFSGAVLYAYYESRQERTNTKVEEFVGGFGEELDNARKIIQAEGDKTKEEIQNLLEELRQFAASGATLTDILNRTQPSVWFVSTLDDAGAPSVGSAFVVFGDGERSYLVTSFATVRAATQQPGPEITVRKGDQVHVATLFTWDPNRDLALLSIEVGDLPALPWAAEEAQPKLGDRLFAIGGLGSANAAITQGFVVDVSADGVQHDAPIGPQFQGGPLINADGQVIAVASRAYSPLGFQPDTVFFGPLVRSACEVVLSCPAGTPQAPG